MHSSLTTLAALLSAVNAVPVSQQWSSWSASPSTIVGPTSTPGSSPPISTSISSAPAPAPTSGGSSPPLKSGNPFSFPLPNGFDGTLSGAALQDTNVQAHGTQPNGAAPMLSEDDLTSFQLIAFNEIFEVAFFTDLIANITNNVPGFVVTDNGEGKNALIAIQAQEEIHADNANAILMANGKDAIKPCQYKFPTTSLDGALALAKTFTDVVMGTLMDVQMHLASNGAAPVVPIIGGVIGQEGEQTGFFRFSAGRIPSSQPFLTRASREFAFSALNQMFVVEGSCPNSKEIDLPVFAPLTVVTPNITAADQTLSFSYVGVGQVASIEDLYLVYINSQNTPVVTNLTNFKVDGNTATFDAAFPYSENLLNGLTIAAVTKGNGPFSSAEDVAKATIAGPGLIEVD